MGCGLSSGEGGLCSLSSPCSIRGLSVVRCRCPRAVCRRVVDGSERWRYGFSSSEGGLSGLSSPHSFERSVGCTRRRLTAPSAAVADGAERVSAVGSGALPSALGTAPEVRVRVVPLVAVQAAMQASEAARATPVKGVAAVAGSVRTPVWDVLLWSTGWQMYVNRVTVCCVRGLASDATCACAVRTRGSECCCWGEARTRCVQCGCLLLGVCETFQRVSQRG